MALPAQREYTEQWKDWNSGREYMKKWYWVGATASPQQDMIIRDHFPERDAAPASSVMDQVSVNQYVKWEWDWHNSCWVRHEWQCDGARLLLSPSQTARLLAREEHEKTHIGGMRRPSRSRSRDVANAMDRTIDFAVRGHSPS